MTRKKLIATIKQLSDSYSKYRKASIAQKAALKEIHYLCRELIDRSNREPDLRQCEEVIPVFCHAKKIASKRLARVIKAKACNAQKTNAIFNDNIIIRFMIHIHKVMINKLVSS